MHVRYSYFASSYHKHKDFVEVVRLRSVKSEESVYFNKNKILNGTKKSRMEEWTWLLPLKDSKSRLKWKSVICPIESSFDVLLFSGSDDKPISTNLVNHKIFDSWTECVTNQTTKNKNKDEDGDVKIQFSYFILIIGRNSISFERRFDSIKDSERIICFLFK